MRGDYLGQISGRHGKEKREPASEQRGSGRGEHWKRERTMSEDIRDSRRRGKSGPDENRESGKKR